MKTKLVLMFEGRIEYTLDTEMVKPEKKDVITIIDIIDNYVNYTVKEIQYLMVTAIRKY